MNSTASLVLNVIIAITDYYLLMMIVVGLIGNSLSVAVFMGKKLRCLPASHYLTALAIADIVSLLSLIIEHKVVKSFGTEFEAHFFCKSSQYIFYIANFLSVWYVVCYTTERLIVVCFPLKKLKLCTVTRARITVLTVFFLSTLSSGPIIFLIGAVPRSANELYICFPTVIGTFLTVYNAFDTLITALIPMLLIISFNVIIGYKVKFNCIFIFLTYPIKYE